MDKIRLKFKANNIRAASHVPRAMGHARLGDACTAKESDTGITSLFPTAAEVFPQHRLHT